MKLIGTVQFVRDTKSFHFYESSPNAPVIAKVYLPKTEGVAPPQVLHVVQDNGETPL